MPLNVMDRTNSRRFLDAWRVHDETPELDEIVTSRTTMTEDRAEVPLIWGVSIRYAHFLYQLVKMLRPTSILEIGMANGISSAYIAAAQGLYANGTNGHRHVIIDPFQTSHWRGAGRALLGRLKLNSHVTVIEDYSINAVPALEKQGQAFDMAFVDGNHCFDYAISDVLVCDRVLEVGGLLALDDSNGFGVKMAISYLDRHRFNLNRVRFDNPAAHWAREVWSKRRRVSVYQKTASDARGPNGI